jgi:cation diffusion facilitator family transporter
VKIGRQFEFPKDKARLRTSAIRLEWFSIFILIGCALLIYTTLGRSQAMKTAWASDLLAIMTPIMVLAAMRVECRPPSRKFAFGYFRSTSIAFLGTAVLILVTGLYLLGDAVLKLAKKERPPVGSMVLFGHEFWLGWAMIGALITTILISSTLGHFKHKTGAKLHNKVLAADGDMNKADYMSESAAVLGVLMIGFGWWWGDSVAAAAISLSIIWDGYHNLDQVISDLMDETPSQMGESEPEELPRKVRAAAERIPWVAKAAVRLREQGHVLSGEVFVEPRDDVDLARRCVAAATDLLDVDWRLYNLVVMPVTTIDSVEPPVVG